MKAETVHKETFKQGSKTYYNSSIFFPKHVRDEVYVLYGFVRVADNYVDQVPQDAEGFYAFKDRYHKALAGEETGDVVVDSFVELMRIRGFEEKWVEAFLHSMELDLSKKTYDTLDETLEYIYGSAEVIGLFMSKLLGLPPESYTYAEYQGRAMQYINFIRDIAEDRTFGRTYLPLESRRNQSLSEEAASTDPERFAAFIRAQVARYIEWQAKAEEGYKYIPRRYLIPIKTASDMYNWTARRIAKNPFVVFERKVKPSKLRIFLTVVKNALAARA
jgi:phytoene synthase